MAEAPAGNDGLFALARNVEAAHFPDLTSSHDVVPETTGPTAANEVAPLNLQDTPTMPMLTFMPTQSGGGIKIIERIGAEYTELGILLLKDDTGGKINTLVASHPQQPGLISRSILSTWLQGGGREPLTWATLIDVLKQVGLKQLAQDIEKQARPSQHVHSPPSQAENVAAVQKYTKSSRQMPSSTEEFKIQRNPDNQIIVSGAHLFKKQSFCYTGKQVDFIWEEAGISLHFSAVDWVGEIKISVAVVENVDAHRILPRQYRFMPAASATYKITASATLPAPVRVRIQHCAITEKEDALIIMVAHEGPPYYFKPLPGGHFPPKSSYGEIETDHFSLFRYFWNLLDDRECPPMRLSVQIFYHRDNTATFVVTKNLRAHITAVKQTTDYISMVDMPMSCEPTTDAITLSVPLDSNGWRITPSFEPAEIRTHHINTYEPGETCPKIKLRMEWKGSGQPREEWVHIPLSAHGGSINSFALLCKPPHNEPAQGQPQPPAVDTIQLLRNSDTPTLPNLLRFPTLSGAAINIVHEATQSSNFGIFLLNDENGTITGNIRTEHGPDPARVTRAIFRQWLQGTGREPISWATLTAVLREANLTALAHYIQQNLLLVGITDEMAQQLIDEAMKSGSLKQRNVVAVITGLMGSGKTTLLHHLFGMAPPNLYTSTGVAEQSFRGLLHHIIHMSAGVWQRFSHKEIRELLAPLIQAGMKEADVEYLATKLMHDINAANSKPSPLPQSSSLVDNALLATTPSLQKESPSCKEIATLVTSAAETSPEGPMEDLLLELVHMIDTGGQPEAMEVMPSIIHNANLAMVLIDLRFGLLDCPQAHFHEEGVAYRRDFPSRHTTRDIILMLVSTLHAKKSLNKAFRLLIVATHRDCVESDLEVRVDALNKELHSLLLPVLKNCLILSKSPDKIAFVLNLKNPDDTDLEALEVIRREVGKPDFGKPFQTPTSFFVFEQDLVQFAEDVAKRDVLSLDECKRVGARIKMSEKMVLAALILFHRQNTFLYFHHILPNLVFVNPKVPLDVVNGIVRFRYKVNSGKLEGFPARFVTQLNEGIVTEELLAYQDICPHFKEGFYKVQDAITLFCHTFTLAPIQADAAVETTAAPVDETKKEYLMMCLKPAIQAHELHQYLPKSTETVPLVVKFSAGCVPLGCFGSTISCLLSKESWEVIRKEGSPKCLAHNIVALHSPKILVNVVLVDFTQHLEIHIDSDLSLPPDTCSQLYTTVFGAIEEVFNIMQLDTKISPAVVCPCRKVQKKHFATFENRQGRLCCSQSKSTLKPDKRQLLWMGKGSVNSNPTLPQLLRNSKPTLLNLLKFPTLSGAAINIVQEATQNYNFGIFLLNDENGKITDNITTQYGPDPVQVTRAIFQRWLQGTGREPISWATLTAVLREADLTALADNIEHNLRE